MIKKVNLALLAVFIGLSGCTMLEKGHSAKERANESADNAMYKPVEYVNTAKQGPALIVIPGQIKSANATFTEKVTPNNIADFGELELSKANFKVFERADLGPALDEIALAANMGDPQKVGRVLKRGKFKTTKWFVKFDILKAEQVAEASTGADFGAIGSIIGIAAGGAAGSAASVAGHSTATAQAHGVWLVGMRYKVIDANTTEQVTQGYFEQKMEVGKTASTILGFSQGIKEQVTLDTMAQRLVQECVADLDKKK
ncbi:MAG: hypothetical protein ACU84J_13370 [Gammaproteobacteria bacterium]